MENKPTNMLDFNLYIVVVTEDGEEYQYEYSNLTHAREHLQNELNGYILGYKADKYYHIEGK